MKRFWQDKLLQQIFVQRDRAVVWIYDEAGNGKTFLYMTFDGSINTRANSFPAEAEGIPQA